MIVNSMVEKEMSDGELEVLLRVIHPRPKTQDGKCPYISWMGDDLVHCPGMGEWKCKKQEVSCGEYGECTDYNSCSHEDYNSCPVYFDSQKQGRS